MTKRRLTIKYTKFTIGLIFFAFATYVPTVFAAEIIAEGEGRVGLGDQFEVKFYLDSKGESLNTIQGLVLFPKDMLELVAVRDGNSVVNFWIEQPRISSEDDGLIAGELRFSGIIPGGYRGSRGIIFNVVFQSKKSGSGTIKVDDVRLLLNDGNGSDATVSTPVFRFSISDSVSATPIRVAAVGDEDPPEVFEPSIANSSGTFDGGSFLVFVAQDKGSGIDHYEVYESEVRDTSCGGDEELCWQEAISPYLLADQSLRSEIRVKAVDKAGNERIVTMPPTNPQVPHNRAYIFLAILGIVAFWILYKYTHGARTK